MATMPAGSVEYLHIDLEVDGEVPSSPTVEVALVLGRAAPTAADWRPASWVNDAVRYLVDGTRGAGRYSVWIRVSDNPERVVRRSGELLLT